MSDRASRRIDTWKHVDRRTAARVLGCSYRLVKNFEEDGTLTPHRDDRGRVFYARDEVERLRDERRRTKADIVTVDVDEATESFRVVDALSPTVLVDSSHTDSESVRHQRLMEQREREYDQRERLLETQDDIARVLRRQLPRITSALERLALAATTNTVIQAIPDDARKELLSLLTHALGSIPPSAPSPPEKGS